MPWGGARETSDLVSACICLCPCPLVSALGRDQGGKRGKLESVPLTLSLYASVFAFAEDSWTEDQYESDSSLIMEGVMKKGVGWRCGHELSSAWVEALRRERKAIKEIKVIKDPSQGNP